MKIGKLCNSCKALRGSKNRWRVAAPQVTRARPVKLSQPSSVCQGKRALCATVS